MSRLLTAIIFLLGISSVYAAKVDTVEVYSASMKKKS